MRGTGSPAFSKVLTRVNGMLQSRPAGTLIERAAGHDPVASRGGVRGLSDRAVAWVFIAPTILLLLAINIFPLIWTIRLSFTNYRANRPNAPLSWLGLDHYYRPPHRPRHLARHAGDGAFRALDDRDRDRARLRRSPI